MIEAEAAIFTVFALLLGAVLWWTWRQRRAAEHEAAASAEFAVLGRGMCAIADDLSKELAVLAPILRSANAGQELERSALDQMERATDAAISMLDLVGSKSRDTSAPASVEGVVRLAGALLKRSFPEIHIAVEGELRYFGRTADAMRVVQNLLLMAVARASMLDGGQVLVRISDGSLSITSAVQDPASADHRVGQQTTDSPSGLDRSIVGCAARIGWTVRCRLEGDGGSWVVESAGVQAALDGAQG